MDLSLFVACAPGLEPLLAVEVASLAGAATPVPGGVELRGDLALLSRLLLGAGLASHVLVRVASFHCRGFDELATHVERLPWSGWLRRGVPRTVRVTTARSRLVHTGAIAERILDGVTRRLGDAPPAAETDEDAVPLVARLVGDRCTISLDASGPPLHRRGYRLDPRRAPLREDLARAVVLASGWDRESLLVDPMCGSGTLAIEAALLATGRAPGLSRRFALERTALDDGVTLEAARRAAEASIRTLSAPVVVARDRDPLSAAATRANAARAGVLDAIAIEAGPLSTTLPSLPATRGPAPRLVTNPPWGARLGEAAALRPLYRAVGSLRRALGPSARLTLVAHDRRLAYATAIPLESAFLSDLGGLKVHAMIERAPGAPPPVASSRGVH